MKIISLLLFATCVFGKTLAGGHNNDSKNIPKCEGDCDDDQQCAEGLKCQQRHNGESVTGCELNYKYGPEGPGKSVDMCFKDNDNDDDEVVIVNPSTGDSVEIVSTVSKREKGNDGDRTMLKWDVEGAQPGDILVLIAGRTDAYMAITFRGWNHAASCQTTNGKDCHVNCNCKTCSGKGADEGIYDASFCSSSGWTDGDHDAQDLNQVVFWKQYDGETEVIMKLPKKQASWGHLNVVRNADPWNPIGDWADRGMDTRARFNSVTYKKGDLILFTACYDDAGDHWGTINGYDKVQVGGDDDHSYQFTKVASSAGSTGEIETDKPTGGAGGKLLKLSLVIRKQGNSEGKQDGCQFRGGYDFQNTGACDEDQLDQLALDLQNSAACNSLNFLLLVPLFFWMIQ